MSDMTDNPRKPARLDIDRARAALSLARSEGAAAVRSPRPADLRHLQDDMQRRAALDARVAGFRDKVHGDLGVGAYAGPFSAVDLPGARQSGLALCDAEICAPAAPPAPSHAALSGVAVERTAPPAPEAPPMAEPVEVEPAFAEAARAMAEAERALDEAEPVAEPEPDTRRAEAPSEAIEAARASGEETPSAPTPKKRRKFLGVF